MQQSCFLQDLRDTHPNHHRSNHITTITPTSSVHTHTDIRNACARISARYKLLRVFSLLDIFLVGNMRGRIFRGLRYAAASKVLTDRARAPKTNPRRLPCGHTPPIPPAEGSSSRRPASRVAKADSSHARARPEAPALPSAAAPNSVEPAGSLGAPHPPRSRGRSRCVLHRGWTAGRVHAASRAPPSSPSRRRRRRRGLLRVIADLSLSLEVRDGLRGGGVRFLFGGLEPRQFVVRRLEAPLGVILGS